MRLICGVVRLDGSYAQTDVLAAMFRALGSPGLRPQITSTISGSAALGVLDFGTERCGEESSGQLPKSDDIWLAADARLERPRELAEKLSLGPGTSDPALLLAATMRWEGEVPDHVDGDFALAAWWPAQFRLLCMRDRAGVRPLAYTHLPGRLFAFASLPRGLHASGVVPLRLDRVALGRVLVETYSQDGLTGFEGISWLPAGHSLALTPEGVRIHQPSRTHRSQIGSWRGSRAQAAADLRGMVEEAVACRLGSSNNVAVHLSGGLDSSAIAALAARQLRGSGRSLYAFSKLARPAWTFTADERDYVSAVLAQEGDINWSPVYHSALDEEGTWEPDLALGGSLADPDDLICAAAAAAGCRILLAGAGGDEGISFQGSDILLTMLREFAFSSVWCELKARSRRERKSLTRLAASHLLVPLLPRWIYRRMRKGPPPARRRNALSFLRAPVATLVMESLPPESHLGSEPGDRLAMMDTGCFSDRATRWSIIGARHGIAFTYPLANRRILDFVLSLPTHLLVDGGFSRQPYRNAMEGILPEAIRWRESKYVPFPDIPANIVAAAPGLLAQVDRIRSCAAVTDMFQLDTIADAIARVAPYRFETGSTSKAVGQPSMPYPMKMALHAVRALAVARYVARMS